MNKSILVITNLYPVPWAPNRASFNRIQFAKLAGYHQVYVVVLVGWIEWWRHRHQATDTDSVIYCPYFYLPKVARVLVPYFQYLSLLCLLPRIRKLNCSVLLASWGYPDAVAVAMLNSHLKRPFFVKVHGSDVNEHIQYAGRRQLMRKYLSKADGIFVVSKDLCNKLKGIGISEDKLLLNYNGVEQQLFQPAEQYPGRCIFIGSLIDTKGVHELIDAFTQLCASSEHYHLDIVGDGPLFFYLKQLVSEKKLGSSITLHGSLSASQVSHLLAKASLLVLPSHREGVPNVILEAFACGVPVVATKVGGIPEVVTQDVGLLVAKGDIQQLTKAMFEALHRAWDKQQIVDHARQFDWGKNITFVRKTMRLI
ncbi:glycosyltransferase [Thalassotalea ponticola]|uniref:glycosyltransferase n=1 Tax=Thalassotalea ponticola TaxID=1523392 RepID=UPI0025B2CCE6|nr:glycosyltransferase [Thalassotalea ponticola]MDN3652427.1 glycosyltransferase [Thalassotalea ponticola]